MTDNLGPVTSKDTIYQIITDRFVDGDKSNNVPTGTKINFKFIKKDSNGKVTWESGENHVITSSSDSTGVVDTETFNWRY